jgi:sugar (pentulose or hexulose) kinase
MMVAGVGAGVWGSLDEAISVLRVETETLPDPAAKGAYGDAFARYSALYHALKPVYDM